MKNLRKHSEIIIRTIILVKSDVSKRDKMSSIFCRKGIDNRPSYGYNDMVRGSAGIGRQARLRGVCASVWVQVPSAAPTKNDHRMVVIFRCNRIRGDLKPRPSRIATGKTPQCRCFQWPALRTKTANGVSDCEQRGPICRTNKMTTQQGGCFFFLYFMEHD